MTTGTTPTRAMLDAAVRARLAEVPGPLSAPGGLLAMLRRARRRELRWAGSDRVEWKPGSVAHGVTASAQQLLALGLLRRDLTLSRDGAQMLALLEPVGVLA